MEVMLNKRLTSRTMAKKVTLIINKWGLLGVDDSSKWNHRSKIFHKSDLKPPAAEIYKEFRRCRLISPADKLFLLAHLLDQQAGAVLDVLLINNRKNCHLCYEDIRQRKKEMWVCMKYEVMNRYLMDLRTWAIRTIKNWVKKPKPKILKIQMQLGVVSKTGPREIIIKGIRENKRQWLSSRLLKMRAGEGI